MENMIQELLFPQTFYTFIHMWRGRGRTFFPDHDKKKRSKYGIIVAVLDSEFCIKASSESNACLPISPQMRKKGLYHNWET
jgi:hypothetical protein